MVRQWQEFFYERRYAATPLYSPDYVKIADAYGLKATSVSRRSDVVPAIDAARAHKGTAIVEFRVEQEDTVYPMVPAGADLHAMIRRPNPLVETAEDA
jgi:acetolactate synthase-1/2/3 large subunit